MNVIKKLPIFGINEVNEAWDASAIGMEEFIKQQKPFLDSTKFGCTFSYTRWKDRTNWPLSDGIDTIVDTFGLKHIRTDIRWSYSEKERNTVDLSTYKPLLDILLAKPDLNLCLNIGPIKTLGWPEEHLPSWLPHVETPPQRYTIRVEDPIAQYSLEYLETLCTSLKTEYGSALDSVQQIQLNNEPFNPMGKHKWTMSYEYQTALHRIAWKHFPGKTFLWNSAGRLQLRQSVRSITQIQKELPEIKTCVGYDHYYNNGELLHLPLVEHFDSINFGRFWLDWRITKLFRELKKHNIGFEITEAQLEPWGIIKTPGNSLHDLQFMLLRLWNNFLPNPHESLTIKYWGIETLAQAFLDNNTNPGQGDIIEFFQSVTG